MKKTLSLLLALVMVIGLFPVFADEAKVLTAEEAGAILQGYGAIKGGSDGDLMIDKELKRQDAVVILTRLMGKETDALATQAAPSFEDITIDYYKPFLAFAEANKWVEGKKEKTFGFNDVTTVKEFAAMLLRALGHDTTGENYPKVMDLAKELKLFEGATVEENAPIVRGIAFILMNNTLETAPKGEDKALVYKLGYKEEPKPQGFVVTEAKAAGRKAIDITFSKAIDPSTLFAIDLKDGAREVAFEDKKHVSEDGMTVRIILSAKDGAKQDAQYDLTVASVKTADGKETVEKFEAKVSMTDQVRPEVKGVEVLNPKTLLVKTSEPINKKTMTSFTSMKEFKIDGKDLTVKVMNAYKDEIIVELYNALKPGDYKLEVSGLRDFDGLIAKTEEFDITVVEDKEAPAVVEAKMVTVKNLVIMFNEPLKTKGQLKVNGKDVPLANITIDQDDQKVINVELTDELDLGAVVEVGIQHKGQRDAMGNTVKDWTKFTFKVADDTEIPAVESVSVSGSRVVVKFNKAMYPTGDYSIKNGKGKVVVTGNAKKNWGADKSKFVFNVPMFASENSDDYTLVLENFKDGTVRGNKLPKTEMPFSSKDLKAPIATEHYVFDKEDGYYFAHIFFNEDMDVRSLEDPKNYTFVNFVYNGKAYPNYRADGPLADVNFVVKNGSKEVMIETNDKNITSFGKIILLGQKDLAGNLLARTEVKERGTLLTQYVEKATLMRAEGNEGYVVRVQFKDNVKAVTGKVFELVETGTTTKVSDLSLLSHAENSNVVIFKVDSPDKVTNSAKTKTTDVQIDLNLVDGDNAKSVYGEPANDLNNTLAGGGVAYTVVDKVTPMLTKNAMNGKITIDEKATRTVIGSATLGSDNAIFDEKIATTGYSIRVTGSDYNEPATVNVNGLQIVVPEVMQPGVYTVHIGKALDANNNDNIMEEETFQVTVGDAAAVTHTITAKTFAASGAVTEVLVKFSENVTVDSSIAPADVTVRLSNQGSDATVSAVAKEGNDAIKLTLSANNTMVASGTTIKVSLANGKVIASDGGILNFADAESVEYKAAVPVKIVKAKVGGAEKIIVEFSRELGGAPVGANIKVYKKDGTHLNKYNTASIVATNEKQLEISASGSDGDIALNDEIYVKIESGHGLKDKQFDLGLVDDGQTETFKVAE